jgi:PilZ domain-containing protein
MDLENSGADYLRKLKGDLEAPARPETTGAHKEHEPDAPERRQSPRYKCQGSAQFCIKGSDIRTWGTLTDISLRGCYIEMMATFPVGATVDLLLELNGVRAEVTGEIRVSYPCLGMGIAFREISDANRARLLEMLRTLAPADLPTEEPHAASPATHLTLPIIINPAAALQTLADFFETHLQLSKEEFVRLLRKSQGIDDSRENRW